MKYKNRIFLLLLSASLCLLVLGMCTRFEKAMLVKTENVTNILINSAEASGQLIDLGEGVTQHGHCYSKFQGVTIADSTSKLGPAPDRGNFISYLVNLEAGTNYYIKAYMSNGNDVVYGNETTFLTASALEPVLTTNPATSITTVSAITGGYISDDGGAPILIHGVCWNTVAGPTTLNSKTNDGPGKGNFISNITGLTVNTTYYVRSYATNSKTTAYGNEIVYTTNSAAPTLPAAATAAATSLTNTTATLNGAVIANGSSTGVTFEYGPTILYGYVKTATPGSVTGVTPISISTFLTGLIPGTIYHFRIKTVNEVGTVYSSDLPFTTLLLPAVTLEPVTSIASTTASFNGMVNPINLSTQVTFEYGTTLSYGSSAAATPNPVFGGISVYVSAAVTGLTSGTLYHLRMKAVSTGGTTYSDDIAFATHEPPTATTAVATSVEKTTATLNGTVNANNSSATVSFEYGLTTSYGSSVTAVQSPVIGTTSAAVNVGITGLSSDKTYHFRVKSVSNGGTAFGTDKSFTTKKH